MLTDTKYQQSLPDIWGGIECTINRVEDRYKDQLSYSGHYTRLGDIERISELGIKALRYPVLWERHQQNSGADIDWTWISRQLRSIKDKNIDVIAGLMHHGSGPSFTDLLDPLFPEQLASYATLVAKKFPWIEYYTPVNEPLTTARFSGLYGLWYPHHKNDKSFYRMLINQVKAISLAMQAIRRINPSAKLIQTEDLGKTHSTPLLKYQADFENKRRWLTYDLLCGKIDEKHFFWKYFISHGVQEDELFYFIKQPCAPHIAGFNYYVTSERYLDEQIENYPVHLHGGNRRHVYADTEAVRKERAQGAKHLLSEAWRRYKLPLALTEVHLHCTREQQMRWLGEIWDSATALKKKGVDIRAVTAWALLGAFDWNSLLTQDNRYYESGVFSVRNNQVNHTAISKMVRSYASTGAYDHPLMNETGWWHNSTRLSQHRKDKGCLLVIGKTGTLGTAFSKVCDSRAINYIALTREQMDITDELSIAAAIERFRPWGIINASGYVKVDDAEINEVKCYAVNSKGPASLARVCRLHGIKLLSFSTDFVFDGKKNSPYVEDDTTSPLNVYGKSKLLSESLIQVANPGALIIRTSSFFGPWDRYNFAHQVISSLNNQTPCYVLNDVIVSPTYLPDLVNTCLDLFIDDESGVWHIVNDGMLSWADFAGAIAERAGFRKTALLPKALPEMGWKANRPLYSALKNSKGVTLPTLENAIERYFEQKLAV